MHYIVRCLDGHRRLRAGLRRRKDNVKTKRSGRAPMGREMRLLVQTCPLPLTDKRETTSQVCVLLQSVQGRMKEIIATLDIAPSDLPAINAISTACRARPRATRVFRSSKATADVLGEDKLADPATTGARGALSSNKQHARYDHCASESAHGNLTLTARV